MARRIHVSVVEFGDRAYLQLQWRDPKSKKLKTRSSGVPKAEGVKGRKRAEREAGKLQAELEEHRHRDPANTSWGRFKERFEAQRMPKLAESTCEKYDTLWKLLDEYWPRPANLAEFTSDAISTFSARLASGRSPATVAIYLRHLKAALRWAKKIDLIHEAPWLEIPKADAGGKAMKGRPVTADEFAEILLAIPEIVHRRPERKLWARFLRGLWWSGLRLSEALALSWDEHEPVAVWMQPGHNLPIFSIQKPRGRLAIRFLASGQKARRSELVPIAPEFAMMLERVPEAKRHGLVFPLPTRSRNHASKRIAAMAAEAGVYVDDEGEKPAGAHDLRRAFGTRWAPRVMPAVLQKLMRHKSIQTTMAYYVDIGVENLSGEVWAAFERSTNSLTNTRPDRPLSRVRSG